MSNAQRSPGSPGSPGRLSSRALWDWLGAATLVSVLVSWSVVTQSLILGSSAGGWTYGYVLAFSPTMLLMATAATALAAALLFGSRNSQRDWPVVLAWIAVSLCLDALMRSTTPFGFARLFASDGANAFYSVTGQFRASAVLGDFDRVRAQWPLHAQSNMPGKLMLVYAVGNVSRDPGVLAWLTVLVSNAGAAVMYAFVRQLFDDRRVAMYSAALYLFVPAKLYFFPLLNTVTPVIALACAALLLKWLRGGSAVYAAALGAALYGLVFFEPLPLVMGLLFALLVVRAQTLGQITWRQIAVQAGIGAAAWLFTYAAVRFLTGFDLLSAFQQIGGHAVQFNADAGRPYAIWVRANLVEFLFGIGVCQAMLFFAALADGYHGETAWRDRVASPIIVLCAGLAAVLLVTDAIGVNRGEVIRLWIFLACFFQIPAAYVCARLDTRWAITLVIAVTVLQATLGTAMIGFIVPG